MQLWVKKSHGRKQRKPLCIDMHMCVWWLTIQNEHLLLGCYNEIPRMTHYRFFHTLVVFCSFPVLTSILAQFPDINPYHWPGWFVTAEAMFIATAVALCFTETRSCKHIKSSHFKFSSSLAELRLFTKTRTKPCIRLIVSFFSWISITYSTPGRAYKPQHPTISVCSLINQWQQRDFQWHLVYVAL